MPPRKNSTETLPDLGSPVKFNAAPGRGLPPAAGPTPNAGPGAIPNVFAGISPCSATSNGITYGLGAALTTLPDATEPNKILSPIGYNIDRLANTDTATKPGTLEGIKRNEEIWAFIARHFNNYHASLCPGVTIKQLCMGSKSLNDRLRPLYDYLEIPCGFTNRF